MKKHLILFITLLTLSLFHSAAAQTNSWQWQPTPIPRALVFEGVWSDLFKIQPALRQAGVPYRSFYMTDLPRQYPDLHRQSVIVLVNADAAYLEQQQIKDFVANGGGLVVLGGFWTFNCGGFHGGYKDGVIVDTMPVTWPSNTDIPETPAGLPLTRAPGATWLTNVEASAKPMVYYLHTHIPKSDATVQLLAGDQPAIVSSTFGKGRVVTVALTINGQPPAGALPFWEWDGWPNVLAQTINWAAGARPLDVPEIPPGTTTRNPSIKALTKGELDDLALGMKVPKDLLARALAYPRPEVAQVLLEHILSKESDSKITLTQALPALLPYAKPAWGPLLTERAEATNPDKEDRNAALILLGASHWPDAVPRIIKALATPDTRLGAVEGLGRSGSAMGIEPLIRIYDGTLHSIQIPNEPERFNAGEFADKAGLASEAALALYRLGAPGGVQRVIAMHRRVDLYWHIFHVAGRGSLRNAGPAALARMKAIHEDTEQLAIALEKLNTHAQPIPTVALAEFIKVAQTATHPTEVDWMEAELEHSLNAFPSTTWEPLTTAKDGMMARLARYALERKNGHPEN